MEGEPEFKVGPRQPIAQLIGRLVAQKRPRGRPFLLAVDGRSSNGKSNFAGRIALALPGTSVVHTDDIAWWHSRFGWDDLLISGVLAPLRRGEAVDYRPPAWDGRAQSRPSVTPRAHLSGTSVRGYPSAALCAA